jgi:hypothetical protein
MLSDKRATKKAILEGLKALIAKGGTGDTLVFHYSGHGSQVRCTEGDELADGLDEIICPWDFDWDGTFIKDDDFATLFEGLKKAPASRSSWTGPAFASCRQGSPTRKRCGPVATASGRATWRLRRMSR